MKIMIVMIVPHTRRQDWLVVVVISLVCSGTCLVAGDHCFHWASGIVRRFYSIPDDDDNGDNDNDDDYDDDDGDDDNEDDDDEYGDEDNDNNDNTVLVNTVVAFNALKSGLLLLMITVLSSYKQRFYHIQYI